MGLYKYYDYSDLEFCFQGQMKLCKNVGLIFARFSMKLVGVEWGIARATVNVTSLGWLLVTRVKGSE